MLRSGWGRGGGNMPAERLRLVTSQDQCDAVQADARGKPGDRIRRALSEPPLAPSADLVERRLAEEIDYARRLIVDMGERLSNDVTVIARHGGTLQGFDVVAQMLGHLSSVVGAADRASAVERIGMADLRGRITRRALNEEGIVRLP